MISKDEIRRRIYNEFSQLDYDGLDMSGCRDEGGIDFCRLKNYIFIKEKFNDVFWDLEFKDFKLWAWKGSIWWGEKNFRYSISTMEDVDFTGESTENIILFLARNKPYPKKEILRIISLQDRYEVLKRQKWKCNQCGCNLKYKKTSNWEGKVAHIDHIHPFSKKDSYSNGAWNINETSNLQALCPKCNLSKSNKKIQ